MKEKLTNILKQLKENTYLHYMILFIISVFLFLPLLGRELTETHDGRIHILRLIGVADAIKAGQIPPLLSPYYCYGYGYAINLFYPPLVTYGPLIFKLVLTYYSTAARIFSLFTIFFSAVAMYRFTLQVTKSKGISLLSSIFYIIAPYKLSDIYTRFAIGEFTAFIFIPIVFQGLYNLIEQDGKKHYLIAIGAIGLCLTHTITLFYVFLLCTIYLLFNIKKVFRREVIQKCIIDAIFILFICSFFLLPMLEQKMRADYAIFEPRLMATTVKYADSQAILLKDLFWGRSKEEIVYSISIPVVIGLILSIFVYKKVKDKKYQNFYLLSFFFSFLLLYMSTKYFPWYIMPKIFGNIQYPWRLIGIAVFFLSFIVGINFSFILTKMKEKRAQYIAYSFIIAISVLMSIPLMTFYQNDVPENDYRYEEEIKSAQKISYMAINRDYMPIKALDVRDTYLEQRDANKVYLLQGKANIHEENKQDLTMKFTVSNVEEGSVIEFPYFYYRGYQAKLVTKEGEVYHLDLFESDYGFVATKLPKIEEGEITISYKATLLTYISYGISIVSMIGFIIYILVLKKKEKLDGKNIKA